MKTLLLLLFFAVQCLAAEVEDTCPQTDISPCKCRTYFDGACIVSCGLASQKHIDKLADIPNLCGGHVHFVLANSKVSGIPVKLWKTLLSSKTVDISIKYSTIEGIVHPVGEDVLDVHTSGRAVIKIDHSNVNQWNWRQLKKFYSEEELTIIIDDTPLAEITADFSKLGGGTRVHKIAIESTGLERIPDKLFAGFEDLESLSLQNNKLTSVSRSLMPAPANKLEFLHLNGNLLTTIPGDLFSDMPSLTVVYLRDNQMKTLPQDVFQSISSNRLRIDLIQNPWECDCKLMQISKSTKQPVNLGVCATPDSLAGKKVKDLPSLLNC